jgi:hypothetical protein
MILYIIKHKKSGEIQLVKFENDRFYFFGHDSYVFKTELQEYFTIVKRTKLEKLL